jgi:hypothetical protein
MKNLFPLLLLILVGCKSTNVNKDSDFKINNESINLYAFIGEKISVTEFDPNNPKIVRIEIDSITKDTLRFESYVMDNGFNCKYKILKNVFNEIKSDTVEFKAYDHYGRPGFENYENVILYISLNNEKGNFYHQKYQFDPIEKSKNGIWKGLNGETIKELFTKKKNGVFTARGLFDE